MANSATPGILLYVSLPYRRISLGYKFADGLKNSSVLLRKDETEIFNIDSQNVFRRFELY